MKLIMQAESRAPQVSSTQYPHMCIVEDGKGNKRGLSLGDLITNGIIEQQAKYEALRKEPGSRAFRKGKV